MTGAAVSTHDEALPVVLLLASDTPLAQKTTLQSSATITGVLATPLADANTAASTTAAGVVFRLHDEVSKLIYLVDTGAQYSVIPATAADRQ